MRRIRVDTIQGNEVLAKNIYTNLDTILMPEGVILRKEYASRLKSLNVDFIYVEDKIGQDVDASGITEMQIKEECQKRINEAWDRLSCGVEKELEKVKGVTNQIIHDLLERPEILFCISGVRAKSEMLYSHVINVCAMSVFVAIRMNLPAKNIQDIAIGSLLHDIGFLKIPDFIKDKKMEEMNKAELREINMHSIYGYDIIEDKKWLSKRAKDIVLYHHELLDGSGYPFQRKEDKICIGCRIVAVCDYFDRAVYGFYAKRCKVHEAIEYIAAQTGKIFDEEVVATFKRSIAAYPNGTLVLTNEGETGIVLRQNENFPTRPVIRMLKNKDGKDYESLIERNLEKELTLFIEDTIE